MQNSKYIKQRNSFFIVIAISSKYAWVIPLEGKKILQLLMLFKKI